MCPAISPKRRVAIVGGGTTGLMLAQGLQKNGYQVTVYEKDAHAGARDRDWTMSVHWSLQHLQRILPDDFLVNLHKAYTDPFYPFDEGTKPLPFFNGPTGVVAVHVPAPDIRRLSRARFRQVLAQGLNIRWGKKLAGLKLGKQEDEPPISLTFEGDETAETDFVIGADGTHSRVRRFLLDEEGKATPSAWSMCNGIVCYGDREKALFLRKPHPLVSLAFTKHGLALCAVQNVPDPDKPETWSFNVLRFVEGDTKHMVGEKVVEQIKTMSNDICEPFYSAIRWIPEGSSFFSTQLDYWITMPWDNRGARVTLAGDAAHAMLPSRGQGMNHAIEDVGNFITQIERVGKGTPWEEAIGVYEEETVKRGSQAVARSLEDCKTNTQVTKLEDSRLVQQGLSV